jgi:hypothetical protein
MLYTSTVAPSASLRIIVKVDSESAVNTVNLGKEIGSGSVSPSDTGEELDDPDPYDLRRGVINIVPVILNVNTFLDGGSRSFMLMWMVRGAAGGRTFESTSTLRAEEGRVSPSGVP